jgi:5-formyltetrahydrofolate cyclo-ligase
MDDAKAELRTRLRAMRRAHVGALGPGGRVPDEHALADILAPALSEASCIASHAAHGPEIDPHWIDGGLASLAFPRVIGDTLEFRISSFESLRPGHRGILEPADDAPLAFPTVLLVPLLAAAPDGTRLGQGGGFYDRALAAMRLDRSILAIGLAWDVQLLPILPRDPWDVQLDWIATPTRLVECAIHR